MCVREKAHRTRLSSRIEVISQSHTAQARRLAWLAIAALQLTTIIELTEGWKSEINRSADDVTTGVCAVKKK